MSDSLDSILDLCFNGSEDELEPLFKRAFEISRKRFSNTLGFHAPGMVHYSTDFYTATDPYRFPSVSVSGTGCALKCEHCNGQLLETMIPTLTPEDLWKTSVMVKERKGKGLLVSGGSTSLGNTPILNFIPTLKRIKADLGLDIVVHTGIVYPEVAESLGDAGVDGAMLDIIGDIETCRKVYHLNVTPQAFDDSMTYLENNGVPIMPHIVVGLYYGKITGEPNALRMIANHDPASVIVVAFKPLERTPMENVIPSSPMDIARVLLAARLALPDKPVILGCARPHGEHRRETDKLAIKAGINGIAYPTEEGYEYARGLGLQMKMSDKCCSLMDDVLSIKEDGA
ncbi:MAG: radical SAM protein [Candidatus Thorarchaeota archaeon]